jgi:hypothetical protein
VAQILVREEGCVTLAQLAGVAVGYSDEGVLVVEDVALEQLNELERGRVAQELRRLAALLSPRRVSRVH